MNVKKAAQIVKTVTKHSDLGRRGRPGIRGTQAKLDQQVQTLLTDDTLEQGVRVNAATRLIEAKIREAYKVWDAL